MSMKAIKPTMELAREHFRRVQDALHDVDAAIDQNNRAQVLGSLLMALDSLTPLRTLIEASLLVGKAQPR